MNIWVAIKGFNYQGGGRPIFYANSEEDLIKCICDRGYTKTEWPALFEDADGRWIRVESVPFGGDGQ